MDKAVILARGLGTRIQKPDNLAAISEGQAAIAETGIKAMIPIGRPFLDYVISALADAGYRKICLVVAPEHKSVRQYYESLKCTRIKIEFAVQDKPLGTADAVIAAEHFAAGENFCVINSDNYYPVEALRSLRELNGPGLIGFEREALLSGSNIEPKRIADFAILQTDSDGLLTKIIEKPDSNQLAAMTQPLCVSMNCWRFNSAIFTACKTIKPSPRGELELPDAVQYAIEALDESFYVLPLRAAVLDMSSRRDIKSVEDSLADVEVLL